MKKILFFILLYALTTTPYQLYSWDGEDHHTMTRYALHDVTREWKLYQPITVTPIRSFLKKLEALRPEFRDPWFFSNYLKINTTIDLDMQHADTKGRSALTPFEILSSYATDPDEGRDEDLFVRDAHGNPKAMFPDQVWFGELQGANSKAFRHLEKPPFSFAHPITTFGFPFRKLGEATDRAEIYYQLSLLAFSLDEPYWGWRFLAGSFHYLQDLHQPYHAAQITPSLASEAVHAFFDWGHKQDNSFRGFIRTAAHLVSNSHRFYESYMARPGPESTTYKENVLKSLMGTSVLDKTPDSVKSMAIKTRDDSNLVWADLERWIHHIMTPKLQSSEYSLVTETEPRDKPESFLVKESDFDEVNQRIFEVTQARFTEAGKVMRTEIRMILDQPQHPDPKSILAALDRLLSYTPTSLPQ